MKKALSTLTLTSALVMGTGLAINAETIDDFQDVQNHWAEKEMGYLIEQGLMQGKDDGTFRPNEKVTRSQVAKVIAHDLDLSTNQSTEFKDLDGHWAEQEIQALAERDILNGYEDGTFKPSENITRVQMAKIMTLAYDLERQTDETFRDISDSFWGNDYIHALLERGIVVGNSDGDYEPYENVTRGHFATFMARTLDESYRVDQEDNDQEQNEEQPSDDDNQDDNQSVYEKAEGAESYDWVVDGGEFYFKEGDNRYTIENDRHNASDKLIRLIGGIEDHDEYYKIISELRDHVKFFYAGNELNVSNNHAFFYSFYLDEPLDASSYNNLEDFSDSVHTSLKLSILWYDIDKVDSETASEPILKKRFKQSLEALYPQYADEMYEVLFDLYVKTRTNYEEHQNTNHFYTFGDVRMDVSIANSKVNVYFSDVED